MIFLLMKTLEDYNEFLRDKEAYAKSKTFIGKIQYLLAKILSAYCLYRIIMVSLSRNNIYSQRI